MQRARRCFDPADPRHEFVWLEHYPAGILSLMPEGYFQRVHFRQEPDGSLACPQWDRPICQGEVETSFLGCPLGE